MRQFELRFLDRLDKVMLVRVHFAADDLTALAEAQRQCATHTIEIWDGIRKVARVKKDNRALTTGDRLCG